MSGSSPVLSEPLAHAAAGEDSAREARRGQALAAARRGLDFLVRHQMMDRESADHGRFATTYDTQRNRVLSRTTNWTSGVCVAALLLGHSIFGDEPYLEAARRATGYLRSLQIFSPSKPELRGIFNEATPQSPAFHPRDALTAAWGLLDWADYADDEEARLRATLYADWFVARGFDEGYPRWTVGVDGPFDRGPRWYGSFHSGSAFFLARMYSQTGDARYRRGMERILSLYNRLLLSTEGRVKVIVDIARQAPLADDEICRKTAPLGWVRMHEYNDDFGALANLEAGRLTNDERYHEAAMRFLCNMIRCQRADGGFGPDGPAGYSVPSAGGSVLLEMLAARVLGLTLSLDEPIERALDYVLSLQVTCSGAPADGAFGGMNGAYQIDGCTANVRSGAYALLALLHYAGAKRPIYFPTIVEAPFAS